MKPSRLPRRKDINRKYMGEVWRKVGWEVKKKYTREEGRERELQRGGKDIGRTQQFNRMLTRIWI